MRYKLKRILCIHVATKRNILRVKSEMKKLEKKSVYDAIKIDFERIPKEKQKIIEDLYYLLKKWDDKYDCELEDWTMPIMNLQRRSAYTIYKKGKDEEWIKDLRRTEFVLQLV